MSEELQSGVCGGTWSINQSMNLLCSSPCASTTTDGFGWTAHDQPKTPSDDSAGSIVLVDHDHDSWNQNLIMDDLQQNYSNMDNIYAQNSFEFNPSSYSSSLMQAFFNTDSQTDHHQQQQPCSEYMSPSKPYSTNHLQFNSNTTLWNATTPNFLPHSTLHSKPNPHCLNTKRNNQESKKGSNEASSKRTRMETPSSLPTFKVRKEKLGDRVTALQQLVSPFGKTDTASVLHEAIEYIKFLHDQVGVLSTPYLKKGSTQRAGDKTRNEKRETRHDLKSLGLCLVPISTTFPVAAETTADIWTPTFGGCFR